MSKLITCAVCFWCFSSLSWARSNEPPTAYSEFDFGLTVHKSELLSSNDTTNAIRYAVGAFIGDGKVISLSMISETINTKFTLNDSSSQFAFRDISLNYHFWLLSVGAVINTATGVASLAGVDLFDISASGTGLQLNFLVEPSKGNEIRLNVSSVTTSEVTDVGGSEIEIGPRMNIDLGASFDLTKRSLDFLIGYRRMSYTITSDATYTEEVSSTYFGLGIDLTF